MTFMHACEWFRMHAKLINHCRCLNVLYEFLNSRECLSGIGDYFSPSHI